MENEKKNRIKGVNIVFLITILISVIAPFLPLDFLRGRAALGVIFSQVCLVLPTVIYLLVNRMSYTETVRLRKMRLQDILLTLLFGILIGPVHTLINALSLVFSTGVIGFTVIDIVQEVPFLGGIVLVAVLPAIAEETVYRGAFYNEYSKIHVLKAALLSGFLFGIMHGNINQFCYALILGILLALLVEATGSILSSMLVHFWINASSTVLTYLQPILYERNQAIYNMYKEYGMKDKVAELEAMLGDLTLTSEEWMYQMVKGGVQLTVPEVLMQYGFQALVGGVLAFLVYKKLAVRNGNWYRICASFKPQLRKKAENGTEQEAKQRMITVPLVIGILLGVAYMIFYEFLIQRAG